MKIYLDETRARSSKAISFSNDKRIQETEDLLKEVEGFFVVANLVWALWSLSSSVNSNHNFGHWVNRV